MGAKESKSQLSAVDKDYEGKCKTKSCNLCKDYKRVLSFEDLKPGDHICLGGKRLLRHVDGKQKCLYKHHTIIKEVVTEQGNNVRAVVSSISFTGTPFDENVKVREVSEVLDLTVHEVYVVKYIRPKFTPDQAVERAEKALGFDFNYDLLFLNCEHFCSWCITGIQCSNQVKKVIQMCKNSLGSISGPVGGQITKYICKVLLQFFAFAGDDIDLAFLTKILPTYVPIVLQGVTVIGYLIYRIICHVDQRQKFKAGLVCGNCYSHNRKRDWICFAAATIPVVASMIACAMPLLWPVLLGILVPLTVISLCSLWGLPRFIDSVRNPIRGEHMLVKEVEDIKVGDIICFRYIGLQHEAVVSFVDAKNPKAGTIGVIHYALPSLLSKRKVIEETLKVDLGNNKFSKIDYSSYNVHDADEVVRRARMRVGEKKFSLFYNRSCHFCHWAKVNEDSATQETKDTPSDLLKTNQIFVDQSDNQAQSSYRVKIAPVIIKSDVQAGDVITFWYHFRWHKAICTEAFTTDKSAQLQIMAVSYFFEDCPRGPEVKEEKLTYNLLEEDVYIYQYHPCHTFNRQEIIQRARARIGERGYRRISHNSNHLIEEIILLDQEETISKLSDLQEGDIISFPYWCLPHKAVFVTLSRESTETKGKINVIHYSLRHIASTRTIQEEYIDIDLEKTGVKRLKYYKFKTYSGKEVVARARQRVGETKFHAFKNTSNDLVHWAKTDNRQKSGFLTKDSWGIVIKDTEEKDIKTSYTCEPQEGIPVLFTTGKAKGYFQKCEVHIWHEFTPGCMVEYKYYGIPHRGILTEVMPDKQQIKVIHYGANHLLATRTIMEDTITVDLKKERFYIYHSNPALTYKTDTIFKSAKARIGEKKWVSGNRSDDVCRACILSPLAGEKIIQSMECITTWEYLEQGYIIDFNIGTTRHQGILTKIRKDKRNICIIYAEDQGSVIEKKIKVKRLQDFYIYQTVLCHEAVASEDVTRRARSHIGKKHIGSAHSFCMACISSKAKTSCKDCSLF